MSLSTAAEGSARRLKVLLLPPIASHLDRTRFCPGTATDPFELPRLLAADGIEITTLEPGPWPINPFGRAHSLLRALDPWRAVRVLLLERRHDLVVSVMEGSAAPLLLLRQFTRFQTPIVLWDIAPTDAWQLRNRLQDFVVPRLDGLMVLSSSQKGYVAKRWSTSLPVTVIGHHIDTQFYQPTGEPLGDDVLAVGEDVGRDYDTLVAAADGIPAPLVMRTSLPLPPAAEQLPNLRHLRDRVSEPELRSLYARSRFVVVPLSDTLNASGVSTILEAGAMGKATIVSESAAMKDFVIPNETCLQVPRHDAAALRAAILRLLAEPDTCMRLGANARRFVVEQCARSAFARRFAGALRRYAGSN